MDKILLARLNTGKSALAAFKKFEDDVKSVPLLQEMVAELTEKVTVATALFNLVEQDNTAHTKHKKSVFQKAFEMGAALGSSLAVVAKDEVTKAAAVTNESDLKAGKAAAVLARLQTLRDAAEANAEKLVGLKVTAADIEAFKAQVTAFEEVADVPRERRNERKLDNKSYRKAVNDLSEFLRGDITNAVNGLKKEFPRLAEAFDQACLVVYFPSKSRDAAKNESADPAAPAAGNPSQNPQWQGGQNTDPGNPIAPESTN